MDTTASVGQSLPHTKSKRRLWPLIITAIVALPLTGILVLGLMPAEADFTGDDATTGVTPGSSGLKREFPAMVIRPENPINDARSKERIELGRLLFFDPILSGDNDISCATCHHPDLGFTDGRALSMGRGGHGIGSDRTSGSPVRRGAPSLWNAAYNKLQFWDGRAADLEQQVEGPITSDIEMAENADNLVKELKAVPEYTRRFDEAFGGEAGSSITLRTVENAVAAFERTLTANNSPFDRYAAGDAGALTAEQRRGFNLFRSGKTRCFECHGLPTFANRDFKIIGVPDIDPQKPDLGRAEIEGGDGYRYAFKVPSLRNVVLSAPYMHNGRFKTLEEVLDFYAAGGGPGVGFKEAIPDDKIHSYTITPQEKTDLIAFLYALTDESNLPEFPERVPSGLPIVGRLKNPVHDLIAKYNSGSARQEQAARGPETLTVKEGESIQAAIDKARSGDTIEVHPGTYHEQLIIDLDNITLRGLKKPATEITSNTSASSGDGEGVTQPQLASARPILDGEKKLSDAVIATGSNFHIEGFAIRRYVANGVVVQHARGPVFHDLVIDDTGLYGIYPVSCTGVTLENCVASGIADAALYVGQSRDIVVKNCEAHDSVTGIEIENSIDAVVENNYVHNNTGGILVFILPNNVSKAGRGCKVIGNRVINNNHENFGNPNSIVSHVPPGTGILVMAADDNEVAGNEVRGNDCYGVAVFSLEVAFPAGTVFDVGAIPERNWIHDNAFSDNGKHPAGAMARAGIRGSDLVWDASGWSNRWDESSATRSTTLPSSKWPSLVSRAWWRTLNFMGKYL